MLAIRLHETGGPEKLRAEDVPVPAPGVVPESVGDSN